MNKNKLSSYDFLFFIFFSSYCEKDFFVLYNVEFSIAAQQTLKKMFLIDYAKKKKKKF